MLLDFTNLLCNAKLIHSKEVESKAHHCQLII